MGFLPCPTTRLKYLTVRFQGRADYRQPPDPTEAQVGGRYRRPVCRRARGQGCGRGLGLARGGQVWPGAPGPVGRPWEPDAEPTGGVVGQGIASSWTQRHAARPSHECVRMGTGVRRARTGGGGGRSLTACRHRWRRRTSWVPHSHGLGCWWQVEGSLGALSASLPWDLPGKVPGCGTAASLVLGARRAHHRTGPSKRVRGGGEGSIDRTINVRKVIICHVFGGKKS